MSFAKLNWEFHDSVIESWKILHDDLTLRFDGWGGGSGRTEVTLTALGVKNIDEVRRALECAPEDFEVWDVRYDESAKRASTRRLVIVATKDDDIPVICTGVIIHE